MTSLLIIKQAINKTHISKTLKELRNRRAIECKNPNNNKGKIYAITNYGKIILKELTNLNSLS